MSFDAPISYTYPNQEDVIANLVRMARKKILISVSSRLGSLPYFSNPIQKNQFIIDKNSKDSFIKWCIDNEEKNIEDFRFDKSFCDMVYKKGLCENLDSTIESYESGKAPWPITYLFMPEELNNILDTNGVKNIRLAGPGVDARTIPNSILMKIITDDVQRKEFLEFCYEYDKNLYVCGMGKDNLLACGEI